MERKMIKKHGKKGERKGGINGMICGDAQRTQRQSRVATDAQEGGNPNASMGTEKLDSAERRGR